MQARQRRLRRRLGLNSTSSARPGFSAIFFPKLFHTQKKTEPFSRSTTHTHTQRRVFFFVAAVVDVVVVVVVVVVVAAAN